MRLLLVLLLSEWLARCRFRRSAREKALEQI